MSLQSQIYSLVERLAEKFHGVDQRIGGLDHLTTDAKANLVTAINEVASRSSSSTGVAYMHVQSVSASIWTINHNLGIRPSVTILDSGGNEVEADVVHPSVNQTLIRFAVPVSGLARLI